MTNAINWTCTKRESETIIKIMLRAASCMNFEQRGGNRLEVTMDLTACHLNGCPLDLEGLLSAENDDLIHDVSGIMRHINRKTGRLEDCFVPRYAAKNQKA